MTITLLLYEAWMVALGVLAFASDDWNDTAWMGIGLTAAAAVVFGAVRNRPRPRAPWLLFATSLVCLAVGDTLLASDVARTGGPSYLANVCYLLTLPLTLASLGMLTRASVVLFDRARLVEVLVVVCATSVAAWVFLIGPSLRTTHLATADRTLLATSAVGDLLLLLVMLRMVLSPRQTWAAALMALGALGALVGDVMYGELRASNSWHPGGISELCYLVFYACSGAAALHPSMVDLTRPVVAAATGPRRAITPLLQVTLPVPAIVLLVEVLVGDLHDLGVIAVGSIIMGQLVVVRSMDAVVRYRRLATRERIVRETCGTLGSMTEVQRAINAVRSAIAAIIPEAVGCHLAIRVGREIGLTESPCGTGSDDGESGRSPRVDPGTTKALSMVAPGRRSRLVDTESLDPALRRQLEPFISTLACPLMTQRHTRADRELGLVCVAAHPRVLVDVRESVEVLTANLALAVERIVLCDAASRRDDDQHLDAVGVGADVVLILDGDYRIRYASPTLATLLGVAPHSGSALLDLIHPDDHMQVAETRIIAAQSDQPLGANGVWSLRRPDGSRILVDVTFRDLRDDCVVQGFVITMRDRGECHGREREKETIRRALEGTGGWRNRRSLLSRFR